MMRPVHPLLGRIRSTVTTVTWPPVSTGVAGEVAFLLRQLDRSQWLPPETIATAQEHQLRALARALSELNLSLIHI